MKRHYLDTSAIVKRYISESGTEVVGELYRAAERDALLLQFSLWNVGEVLGVMDTYHRRDWITKTEHERIERLFAAETVKLVKLGSLDVLPAHHSYIVKTWKLVRHHHIYQADALQAITAAENESSTFLTADTELARVAREEGLEALNVETDAAKIREAISQG
jgi:predicted nucleic acid-binding protein